MRDDRQHDLHHRRTSRQADVRATPQFARIGGILSNNSQAFTTPPTSAATIPGAKKYNSGSQATAARTAPAPISAPLSRGGLTASKTRPSADGAGTCLAR